MTLSDADRAAIEDAHRPSHWCGDKSGQSVLRGGNRPPCDTARALAALSDAQADLEREQAAHRESLRLAAERNGWTRDERDAARADAKRLAERLSSTGEAYHAQHHDSRPMDECVTSEGCRLNRRALALHRERRP